MAYTLDGASVTTWRVLGVDEKLAPMAVTRSAASSSSARAQRVLDLVGALAIGVALLPFILLVALAIAITSRGPIVFKQRRIGRDGQAFLCWKFRTMVIDAEERLADLLSRDPEARSEWMRDHKLRGDPRITLIGRFLRKTSLDELPQLYNVLEGTMSLVGPRPIVLSECDRYGRYFKAYCSVRPGITGLWQISGRNDVSYRRRVAYDVMYSRRRSIKMDMKILFMTLPSVALQKGAY